MSLVSIIIPTLNEAGNIDPLLKRIFKTTATLAAEVEVVFVDDDSTDGTRERIRAWEKAHPVHLIHRRDKNGLAGAVIEGARGAAGDIAVVMDADLSHPPEAIPQLIRPIQRVRCDMAVGSRYVSGGALLNWPFARRAASAIATQMARLLTDARDPMSGFFAVRRGRLAGLSDTVPGFKIGLELMVSGGSGWRVEEVPITFHDRKAGESKLCRGVVFCYLQQLLTLAGGNLSVSSGLRFSLVGLLGVLLDFGVFHFLTRKGVGLGSAHFLSFLIAAGANFLLNATWSFRKKDGPPIFLTARHYLAFMLVAALALFLRGGVLASLSQMAGWPPQLALLAAIGAAAGVNYLGSAFFVFPRVDDGRPPEFRWRILAIGVGGYALFLRLVYLGVPELIQEEAYYWNYAQHLAAGYLDHPPMVAWTIWLFTSLFGDTEGAVRVGAFCFWLFTLGFGFALTRSMYDRATAFRTVLLLSVLPFFFGVGVLMTPDAPLTACWAGALYFLHRALVMEEAKAWLGAGVCLGLGLLSKYTIVLLAPAVLCFMLFGRRSRRWLLHPAPYMALVIAALLFSPVIMWNAHHDWASFVFQGPRRVGGHFHFALPELLGSVVVLFTPVGFLAVLGALRQGAGRPKKIDSLQQRSERFALVMTLVPLAVFLVFSLGRTVKLNWTGPLWLAILPCVAFGMVPGSRPGSGRIFRAAGRLWPATIASTLLIYGAGLHYLGLGIPGMPYPANFSLVGWQDLGKQVEKISETYEKKTGKKLLVVGMDKYKTASGLAFYRNKALALAAGGSGGQAVRETTGRHLFGRDSLMYRYWFPAKELEGRDLLLVDRDREDLRGDAIRLKTQAAGEVHELVYRKNGIPAGRLYFRLAKGFHDHLLAGKAAPQRETIN